MALIWNLDDMGGIGGDRTIMDALYRIKTTTAALEGYTKTTGKKSAKLLDNLMDAKALEKLLCTSWMVIVKHCIFMIDTTYNANPEKLKHYWQYLCWNKTDILLHFQNFLDKKHLLNFHQQITCCIQKLESYFHLSEADKGLINEFGQYYEKAVTLKSQKVIFYSAQRLIHLLDLLRQKGITDAQSDGVGIKDLLDKGHKLKLLCGWDKLDPALHGFTDFLDADQAAKAAQDKEIQIGLRLAEARAKETLLEGLQRRLMEKKKCMEMATKSILEHLLHAVSHPLETAVAAWDWCKNHTGLISIGAMVLCNIIGKGSPTCRVITSLVSAVPAIITCVAGNSEGQILAVQHENEDDYEKLSKEELAALKQEIAQAEEELAAERRELRKENLKQEQALKDQEDEVRKAMETRESEQRRPNTEYPFDARQGYEPLTQLYNLGAYSLFQAGKLWSWTMGGKKDEGSE